MKYVVLGNGAAGASAAAKLKEQDKASEITVATVETDPAYSKIMLPDYIGNKLTREKLFIRDPGFYPENNIRFLTGKAVEYIETAGSTVRFADGSIEKYDKLLIATGSIPFVPPINGLDTVHYYTINSLQDADLIKNRVVPGKNALIMGGGLTGIEMAFALARQGMTPIIVEREKILLPQQFDEDASGIVAVWMGKEGVRIVTGAAVAAIEPAAGQSADETGKPQAGAAVLADGTKIEFSMLVAAIGTRPGITFAANSGLKCGRGIQVDENLRTSVENIYAAGDVSESSAVLPNGSVSPYIWPNAMAQGKCAAINMGGTVQAFGGTGYAQNMTQLRDMPFISMGLVKPRDDGFEVIRVINTADLTYRKIILRNNVVVGMILIGDTGNAGSIASLIRRGTDVTEFRSRLAEADFKP